MLPDTLISSNTGSTHDAVVQRWEASPSAGYQGFALAHGRREGLRPFYAAQWT